MQQTIYSFLAWLVEEKGSTENTIAAYRNDLSQFLDFLSASTTVETWEGVTEGDIRAYLAELEAREYASATVARKMASARSLFHYLVFAEVLDDDPTVQVDVGGLPRSTSEQLPCQAAQQLWDGVTSDAPLGLRDRALIALVAGTGLKASQVVALNLEDLEPQPGVGTIRMRGRGGQEEVLALSPAVVADLARYVDRGWPSLSKEEAKLGQPSPLFLNARGNRLSRQGLWLVLKRRGEAAGLGQKVSPRALRGVCENKQASKVSEFA